MSTSSNTAAAVASSDRPAETETGGVASEVAAAPAAPDSKPPTALDSKPPAVETSEKSTSQASVVDLTKAPDDPPADDDEEDPFEEEPLPPSTMGIYQDRLYQAVHQRQQAMPWHNLAPHTIGSIKDQRSRQTISCKCRSHQCLRLYCECFKAGKWCSDGRCQCGTRCRNIAGSPERQETIVNILQSTPQAFYPTQQAVAFACSSAINEYMSRNTKHTGSCSCRKSRCLRAYCECYAAGSYCQESKCTCNACGNVPGNKEREQSMMARRHASLTCANRQVAKLSAVAPVGSSNTPTAAMGMKNSNTGSGKSEAVGALPPSAYALPVHVDGKIVQGLAFGRVLPSLGNNASKKNRSSASSGAPSTTAASSSKNKRRLYHDLMLTPSKVVNTSSTINKAAKKAKKVRRETELELQWRQETNRVREFFGALRQHGTATESTNNNNNHNQQATKPAFSISTALKVDSMWTGIQDDLKNVETVMGAAELDIMTRLRVGSRSAKGIAQAARWRRIKPAVSETTEPTEDVVPDAESLLCDEVLSTDDKPSQLTDMSWKELTVLAAQDTALLRETARLVRIKARELCEQRLQQQEQKRPTEGTGG